MIRPPRRNHPADVEIDPYDEYPEVILSSDGLWNHHIYEIEIRFFYRDNRFWCQARTVGFENWNDARTHLIAADVYFGILQMVKDYWR